VPAWHDGRSRRLDGGPFGPFWSLLREPGIARVVTAELAGRMPSGMGPLAIVLLVHGATGSYGQAGAVAGAFAAGQAAGGPLHGRLIDRYGQTVVLCCGAAVFAVAFAALAATGGHHDLLTMCAWAGLAGAAYPPLGPAMQALWSAGFSGARLQTAYAFQSATQELIFLGGPLLVAGLVAWSSAGSAVVAAAVLSFTGTLVFVSSPRSRQWEPSRRAADWAGPLRVAGIRTIVAIFALLAVAFAFLQVATAAFATRQGSPGQAGILLAMWTSGSLTGGILYGSRSWRRPPEQRLRWLLAALAAAFAPPALASATYGLAALMFLAGMPIAPTLACAYALVERLAPAGTVTEAFTWIGSGFLTGLSAGTGVAGIVTDRGGPSTAMAVASAVLAAAATLASLRRTTLKPAVSAADQDLDILEVRTG
jgi:MFS family permease